MKQGNTCARLYESGVGSLFRSNYLCEWPGSGAPSMLPSRQLECHNLMFTMTAKMYTGMNGRNSYTLCVSSSIPGTANSTAPVGAGDLV
jgi:hypothetical protein